jgi:hypothetical protein
MSLRIIFLAFLALIPLEGLLAKANTLEFEYRFYRAGNPQVWMQGRLVLEESGGTFTSKAYGHDGSDVCLNTSRATKIYGTHRGFLVIEMKSGIPGCSERVFIDRGGSVSFSQELQLSKGWVDTPDKIPRLAKPIDLNAYTKLYARFDKAFTLEGIPPIQLASVNLGNPEFEKEKNKESTVNSLLTVSASVPDVNGLVTLSIIVNGGSIASLKVNNEEIRSRTDGRTTLQRFAQVGENKFDVVAIYKSGDIQSQTVTVNRAVEKVVARIQPLNPIRVSESKPRDAVAIIIGIEKYRRVSKADFANRDAELFYDYARRALGVRQENIKLLLDDKADASDILVAFKNWLPTRVGKGETEVYVFYSGHGLPSEDGKSLFFLPHEANRDLLERTAISQQEIVDAIRRTNPKSVTMFIDSCYSGQSRTGETLLANARPISIVAKETSSFPPNFTVISASAPDQISSSSPELKHGIFSYYLMRGMEGEADANGDKQTTVAEMQTYLSENVTRHAMGMNRTQQPQVVGDTSRVLVGR